MIALTEKKCKVGNISSIVDFKNIICRDTCALRETLALCGMKCCNSALIKFLFANLFSSPCAFLQAPNKGDLAFHSHERFYTSGANVDGRRGLMTRRKKWRNG